MTASDAVFAGSIPAIYDRYMVPLIFAPWAEELARRAASLAPRRVLETAAGTGVLTEALHRALPDAEMVATDLNPPMLDIASRRLRSERVRFQPADALELPFEDESFDLVACQFGVMFFPDKVRGQSEAWRILREGGHYLLAIWDKVDRNPATKAAGEAVGGLFPENPVAFYDRIPFRYHDRRAIEADLSEAGFREIVFDTVELRSRAASARDAAIALTQGTPMRAEIEARDPAMLQPATEAAERALGRFEGVGGFDAPMSAHIVRATK